MAGPGCCPEPCGLPKKTASLSKERRGVSRFPPDPFSQFGALRPSTPLPKNLPPGAPRPTYQAELALRGCVDPQPLGVKLGSTVY